MKEDEILQALKGINDLTSSGTDGYGAKIFKATWSFTKTDVVKVVNEFFEKDQMYIVVSSTLATLIPKFSPANTTNDYRPISCCTIIYKIITKILATRLGKVLARTIHQS